MEKSNLLENKKNSNISLDLSHSITESKLNNLNGYEIKKKLINFEHNVNVLNNRIFFLEKEEEDRLKKIENLKNRRKELFKNKEIIAEYLEELNTARIRNEEELEYKKNNVKNVRENLTTQRDITKESIFEIKRKKYNDLKELSKEHKELHKLNYEMNIMEKIKSKEKVKLDSEKSKKKIEKFWEKRQKEIQKTIENENIEKKERLEIYEKRLKKLEKKENKLINRLKNTQGKAKIEGQRYKDLNVMPMKEFIRQYNKGKSTTVSNK